MTSAQPPYDRTYLQSVIDDASARCDAIEAEITRLRLSLAPGDLERLAKWATERRPGAVGDRDCYEPRPHRLDPSGTIPGIDRNVPDFEPVQRMPEWMDGGIR